jgi:hypothetical protein
MTSSYYISAGFQDHRHYCITLVTESKEGTPYIDIYFSYFSQVKDTFNLNFEQIHQDWKTVRYPWLPTTEEISKSLGEHMPLEGLQKLEVTCISN